MEFLLVDQAVQNDEREVRAVRGKFGLQLWAGVACWAAGESLQRTLAASSFGQ